MVLTSLHIKGSDLPLNPGFPQLFHSSPLFRSRYEGTLLQIQIPRCTRPGAVAQRVGAPFQQQRQTAGGAPNGREKETGSIHVQTCGGSQLFPMTDPAGAGILMLT